MTGSTRPVVLITRPGVAGESLTRTLVGQGIDALWWPAFEIRLIADAAAEQAIAALDQFECVVLVSSAAAEGLAAVRIRQGARTWPAGVALAAVGASTLAAARALFEPGPDVPVVAPTVADDSAGAEALWPLLQQRAPRRVLIVRAAHGREWLGERLRAAGSEVVYAAVYRRTPPTAMQAAALVQALNDWQRDHRTVVSVFSSSEAIEVVLTAAGRAAGALRAGLAVATHTRIATQLQAVGFARVQVHPSSTLADALRSIEF